MSATLEEALDERLTEALKAANHQLVLRTSREQLRHRLKQHLTFSINGGTFYVTQELVSFIQTLISLGHEESVLVDINQNPIQITSLLTFLEKVVDLYQEAHNTYLVSYSKLQKSRTTKALVGA